MHFGFSHGSGAAVPKVHFLRSEHATTGRAPIPEVRKKGRSTEPLPGAVGAFPAMDVFSLVSLAWYSTAVGDMETGCENRYVVSPNANNFLTDGGLAMYNSGKTRVCTYG